MIGRTNTGGGSGGLNFKVIPNPQPSTAKENTIWVNTNKINNYYFSATEPGNVVDYDVWISTGTESSIAFNALKKNGIQVYPISAKQYVGGAWVDVTAKSYQGGEWVDWWNGELYIAGDEFMHVTGGWDGYNDPKSDYVNKGTLTKNDVNMTIEISTTKSCIVVRTKNKINVTNYNTIAFDIKCLSKISSVDLICATSAVEIYDPISRESVASQSSIVTAGNAETVTLDVSGDSGSYYVEMWLFKYNATGTAKYEVSEVRLL